jgi:hypothetical protein
MAPLPQCQPTRALAAHGPMPLCAPTRGPPSRFPNAIGGPPAPILQLLIAAVHGFGLRLTLDGLCAVDVRWPGPTPCSASRRWTLGRRRNLATPARMLKLVGNASLLHRPALSARTFGAEEARSLGLLSRVVPGLGAEVLRATIVEFAEAVARMSPLSSWGLSRACA